MDERRRNPLRAVRTVCCALTAFVVTIGAFASSQLLLAQTANGETTAQSAADAKPPIELYFPDETPFQPALGPLVQIVEQEIQSPRNKAAAAKLAERAREVADKLLSTAPRGYHDEILALAGLAEELAGNTQQALTRYKAALDLRANSASVLYRASVVLKALNRCPEAIPLLDEALWRGKAHQHEVLFLLGQCSILLGDTLKGVNYTEQALAIMPTYLPALRHIVEVEQKQLDEEFDPAKRSDLESKILANLGRISQQAPDDRDTALKLARLLFKGSDPLLSGHRMVEAEQIAARFANASKYADTESVRLLFDIQTRQGKLDEAEKTLKAGLRAAPKSELLQPASRQLELQKGVKAAEDPESPENSR